MNGFYNKGMFILKALIQIVPLLKDGKILTIIALLLAGGYYAKAEIDRKHDMAMIKIDENRSVITSLDKDNAQIITILKNLEKSSEKMEQRLWEISRKIAK